MNKIYLMGGFGDTNSDPTDPLEGFDTFFNDNEYFKHVEIGWATGEDRFFYDNVHLTFGRRTSGTQLRFLTTGASISSGRATGPSGRFGPREDAPGLT